MWISSIIFILKVEVDFPFIPLDNNPHLLNSRQSDHTCHTSPPLGYLVAVGDSLLFLRSYQDGLVESVVNGSGLSPVRDPYRGVSVARSLVGSPIHGSNGDFFDAVSLQFVAGDPVCRGSTSTWVYVKKEVSDERRGFWRGRSGSLL